MWARQRPLTAGWVCPGPGSNSRGLEERGLPLWTWDTAPISSVTLSSGHSSTGPGIAPFAGLAGLDTVQISPQALLLAVRTLDLASKVTAQGWAWLGSR